MNGVSRNEGMNQESILRIGDSCLAIAFLDGRLQLMRNEPDFKLG